MTVMDRNQVMSKQNCAQRSQIIEPEEFCRMVVSMRALTRCDDPVAGLRGLEDGETGDRYFVDDLRLNHFMGSRYPR